MFIKYPKQELTFYETQFWNQSQRLSPVQLSLGGKIPSEAGTQTQRERERKAKLRLNRDGGVEEGKYLSFSNYLRAGFSSG